MTSLTRKEKAHLKNVNAIRALYFSQTVPENAQLHKREQQLLQLRDSLYQNWNDMTSDLEQRLTVPQTPQRRFDIQSDLYFIQNVLIPYETQHQINMADLPLHPSKK